MRYISALIVIAICLLTGPVAGPIAGTAIGTDKGGGAMEGISWLGHDTFKALDSVTGNSIYTDPFRIAQSDEADIILVTHEHRDHCSVEDIRKLVGKDTAIVTTADCAKKLSAIKAEFITVKPGDRINVKGVAVEAVAAYNTDKKFHPKENNWVGFVFTANSKRIYLAGDTDLIPEMKEIKCDIALLPVSGTYVMTALQAVQAAIDIAPAMLAIPMHYGAIVGSEQDAGIFADALKNRVKVEIMENASTGGQ